MIQPEVKSIKDAAKIIRKANTKRPNITYRTQILDGQQQVIGTYPGADLPEVELPPGRYRIVCFAMDNESKETEEPEVNMVLVIPGEPEPEGPEGVEPDWKNDPSFYLAERERERAAADAEVRVQTMQNYFTQMNSVVVAERERADRMIAEERQRMAQAHSEMQETMRAWGPPPAAPVVREAEPPPPPGFLERFFEQNAEQIMEMAPLVIQALGRLGAGTGENGGPPPFRPEGVNGE